MRLLKVISFWVPFIAMWLMVVNLAYGVETATEISNYTNNTLSIILAIAGVAEVLFLIKAGYEYMTSAGKPDNLISAKKTIRNAIVGLVMIIGAALLVSIFNSALSANTTETANSTINIASLESATPSDGLTQVLIDAVSAFMQNIIESATKPIVDGVLGYLATTPSLLANKTVVNFWLISLGIVDSLFIVVVALLGLRVMSGDTFGFEEVELKQLIPKIGLYFLGANVSLFLADYILITCNTLVTAVLNSTGGLSHSWVVNIINPQTLFTPNTNAPLITLIFLIIFLIVAILLLFMFITRLIIISIMAVLSPFIFLLWTLPKFSDLAEIAMRSYMVAVFMVFVQVVVIQLAASFLSLPETSNNSLISIAVAIGLFLTLLKVPGSLSQMTFYVSGSRGFKKMGSQLINVISADHSSSETRKEAVGKANVKTPRKEVNL